jgi:hypothetical protein
MKAYVITTGAVFGLLTLAHIWRVIEEVHLAKDPWYVLTTVVSAALCLWALRLVWRSKGS